MFNPGPDEWDLDTLSFVSQLMNGFHGVNGTAAVTLSGELHAAGRTGYIFMFTIASDLMQVDDSDRPCN